MLTYRSELWNTLIGFLRELKDYSKFDGLDNGKIKNRMTLIYNRAIERMRLDKTDFDLLSDTFKYLNEKDVTSEMTEAMNECGALGYKCFTTADGEKIIKECIDTVNQRNRERELKEKLDNAEKAFREKEAAFNEYMGSQNKVTVEFEEARNELDQIKNIINELNSKDKPKKKVEKPESEVENLEVKENNNE